MNYKGILSKLKEKDCNFITIYQLKTGRIRTDKINIVLRHDVDPILDKHLNTMIEHFKGKPELCFDRLSSILNAEIELGIISSIYLMPKRHYSVDYPPFTPAVKDFEFGYHLTTKDIKQANQDINELCDSFGIMTTVAHSGYMDLISDPALAEITIPFTKEDYACDGYITDNGCVFRKMSSFDDVPHWEHFNIDKFIDSMEIGKTYHIATHPIWYNENLDFLGFGGQRPTISACMIVGDVFDAIKKDKMIAQFEKALESIKDLVDETIVVWTDTNEEIAKVAEKYGAKVYKHEYTAETWNFSEARNYSIQYANGEWLLIIDADEQFEKADTDLLMAVIEDANKRDHKAIMFKVLSPLPTSVNGSQCAQPRLFRKEIAGYNAVKDYIHNQPIDDSVKLSSNIRIHHEGYNLTPDEMMAKWKRTEALLLRQLQEHPDYAFAWMNLIRIYRCQGRFEDVINTSKKVLADMPNMATESDLAYQQIMVDYMFMLYKLDRNEEAIEIAKQALAIYPNILDIHSYLAQAYQQIKQYDKAIEHYQKHIELAEKYQNNKLFAKITMDTAGACDLTWNNLGKLYFDRHEFEKARECFVNAVKLNDHDLYKQNLKNTETMLIKPQAKQAQKPIKVLMVQTMTCIRNIKFANALRKRGVYVALAYMQSKPSDLYDYGDQCYDKIYKINDFRELIELSKGFDIIHCHNEPDMPTVVMKGNGVVIHDTHDLMSLRHPEDKALKLTELMANVGVNGRIYCTELARDYCLREYGIDPQTSIIIPNFASEDDVPDIRLEKLSEADNEFHIVYEGGVGSGHRDFRRLFIDLAKNKIHIHVYPTADISGLLDYIDVQEAYPQYIHYNKPMKPSDIVTELTQFDAGIIPFNITAQNKAFLDATISNKFYEYMAAGIPVITSNIETSAKECQKLNCGIVYDTVDDIIANIEKLKGIKNLPVFTVEANIDHLINFYQLLLERRSLNVNPAELAAQVLFDINKQEYATQPKGDMNSRPCEYAWVFNKINEIAPNEVIDVGTGLSAFPALVKHSGILTHAIDNMTDYWQKPILNKHFFVNQVDIADPKGAIGGKTDVITCISCLEHIKDYDIAIRNMIKLVNIGGHVLLTFPYNENDFIENVYKLPDAGYGQDYPYPCHIFNREALERWCANGSAEIAEIAYYQVFTGQYWTMGDKIKHPILTDKDSLHHLACVDLLKLKDIMTQDELQAEEKGHPDLSYQVYYDAIPWDEPTRVNIKNRVNRIVDLAEGKILDVGCSDGLIPILLGEAGKSVIGLDMLDDHIARANTNLKKASPKAQRKVYFTQGWAENLKYFDETYDTVIMGEILEHVQDVDIVLIEAQRVLTPSGLFLASVPIGENATPSHKRFFDADSFRGLLSKYFSVVDIEVYGTQMLAICRRSQ